MLLNPFLPAQILGKAQIINQLSLHGVVGSFCQTICNHLVSRQMLQSDLFVAYMISNSMILNCYVLHFQVVDRVFCNLDCVLMLRRYSVLLRR